MTPKIKTLVVDDCKTNQSIIAEMVGEFCSVDLAGNADEAMRLYTEALKSSEPYQLAFFDIMMPDVTGLHLLKIVRSLEHIAQKPNHCKIIMVTGLGDSQTIVKAFNFGADAYIVKPIDYKNVINKISKLFEGL